MAPVYKETLVKTKNKPTAPVGWRAETRKYVMPLMFSRKGAWLSLTCSGLETRP